ncbi:MAG TPA: L-lysine 6-transaminase [Thermoanaerobaculia bacterium]|nr:L-lysine 6-transaminase [Thermoanaerobaculia bacterium]
MISTTRIELSPQDVLDVLSRHILVDGYHVVMDLERSRGSYLYDSRSDRMLLDFFTNFATYPVGYNHPKTADPEYRERILLAALNKPTNSDTYTTLYAEFVETFSTLAVPPTHDRHLFFVEGGSLAVENAVKTAFDWKVRKNFARGLAEERGHQILHFRHAFHGRSGYSISMTNTADPRKTQYFPRFDWPRLTCPRLSFPVTADGLREVAQAEDSVEREIREACARFPNDIAALIIEPIQGEGGDNHFRPEFFARLRRLADELEFLLIFDEVQTGVGLTGSMWAWQQFGVEPDLFCFGKKTQVCGFASNGRVDEVDSVFNISSRINSTWGGNLADMVRCGKYLQIITEENLADNARVVGEHLVGRLRELAEELPVISNVRGRGLFIAFDLPDKEMRDRTLSACLDNGLIALASGAAAVRFRPALNLSRDEADEGVRKLRRAVASAQR